MMLKKVTTPEEQVIEAIQRIEPLGLPFCAVYVAMSKLHPDNRGYRQLEIVSKLFEPLLNHAQARLFLLSNHDFLLLTANPILDVIDDILYQIRGLFADDFFVSSGSTNSFQHIFFLDRDKAALMRLLKPDEAITSTSPIPKPPVTPKTQELSPVSLEKLLYQIEQSDTMKFIRRQSIVSLNKDGSSKEFGQEFFTSLAELQNAYAPHLNLTADKALFAMLMETLDRRMMGTLPEIKLRRWPDILSLNLNVQSIFTPIFDKMVKHLNATLMVEFQIADVLHNLPLYHKACEKLETIGALWALDGIGVNEFEFIHLKPFAPVYYKFFYSMKWNEPEPFKELHTFAEQHPERVILAHCGTEDALVLGRRAGISLFQGHFMDTLLAAVAKNACTFGQECTLNNCKLRRSVVGGTLRKQCVHEPHLDAFIPLKGGFK